MTRESIRQFFRDWSMPIFLITASFWLYQSYRVGHDILAAKQRLYEERQAIIQTRDKVGRIENRLEFSNVPQRLSIIETAITTAIEQNQESIDKLDQSQKKIVRSLSSLLNVPKEEIDGTKEPVVPPNRVDIDSLRPGSAP